METQESAKDYAYYYPGWIWPGSHVDRMKELLLFFDGIALTLPQRQARQVIDQDPVLAQPLVERGLLVNLEPRTWIDEATARKMIALLRDLLDSPFQQARQREYGNHEPPGAWHWGYDQAPADADRFTEELIQRGLITRNLGDGVMEMDGATRHLILLVLAQALWVTTASSQIRVQPVGGDDAARPTAEWRSTLYAYTQSIDPRHILWRLFGSQRRLRSSLLLTESLLGPTVQADQAAIDLDLSAVPLDEVLAYRHEHGAHFRAYARGLRTFLYSLAQVPPGPERDNAIRQRQEEIRDAAVDLRHRIRDAFRVSAVPITLTIAGAAWTALHDRDPIGAFLAALAGTSALPSYGTPVSAYSYLLLTRRREP